MSLIFGAHVMVIALLAIVTISRTAYANASKGGGDENDVEEILVEKTIQINENGTEHGILNVEILGQDVNLITVLVKTECAVESADQHVSAIAKLDHVTFKTYVTSCTPKIHWKRHQFCVNDTRKDKVDGKQRNLGPAKGELQVIVLGADSTSNWTISRHFPIHFTGEGMLCF